MILSDLNYFLEELKPSIISSEKERAIIEWQRALSNAHFYTGSPKEAKDIASKFINRAKKIHSTDCVIDFCERIRYYYSVIEPSKSKVKKYDDLQKKYLEIRKVEQSIFQKFAEFNLLLSLRKVKEIDESFINEVINQVCIARNFHICIRAYPMLIYYHALRKEDDLVLEYAQEALQYFTNVRYYVRKPLESFSQLSIPILIKKGRFEEAQQLIAKYKPKTKTPNHFRFLQCEALLKFHSGAYDSAYDFVHETSTKGASPGFKEEWLILEAYSNALVELGLFKRDTQFKVGKFLNEIQIWSSDKKGQNINLIILEILFRYARNDVNIHDREPAFRRYILQHTKKGDRSNILLKGLIKWINSNFQYDFEKEKKLLLNTKPESIDMEIIPYNKLIGVLSNTL